MRKFLLACGLMLAFSALSFGGLLQTQTISISITDVPSFTPLIFNQYNGPMTVDKVELIVESSVEAEFTFSNNKNGAGVDAPKTLLAGGMAAGGAATHLVLVQFLGGNVGGAAATASPIIAVNTVLADDEVRNIAVSNVSAPATSDITALLAFLLGGGTFQLDAFGAGDFVLPGVVGGDLNILSDVNGGGRVTVNFYSQIPEPSTYAMMGAGVGLLALARYRRNRS